MTGQSSVTYDDVHLERIKLSPTGLVLGLFLSPTSRFWGIIDTCTHSFSVICCSHWLVVTQQRKSIVGGPTLLVGRGGEGLVGVEVGVKGWTDRSG